MLLLEKMGYAKGEKLVFLNKRVAGLWLVWIGLVIVFATLMGGKYAMNPIIFCVGYGFGFGVILRGRTIRKRFSFGSYSKFQNRVSVLSIILLFLLMSAFSGRYFATMDFRMIWLGALLATAFHFIPFAYVHGKTFIYLSIPLIILTGVGILIPTVPFYIIGFLDGVIKVIFGVVLLRTVSPELIEKGHTPVGRK